MLVVRFEFDLYLVWITRDSLAYLQVSIAITIQLLTHCIPSTDVFRSYACVNPVLLVKFLINTFCETET